MLTALKLSRQQVEQVNWKAVSFFYLLACGISYGLHFFSILNPWFLPWHKIYICALGPIGAAFVTRFVFPSVPKTITWAGTKPRRTALFVAVPLVVETAFGMANKSGQNPHLHGLLVVVLFILYGLAEEAGWRGFLSDALRPLPAGWRILLTATLWLGWHFTFVSDFSSIFSGLRIPFWGLFGLFILGSWGLGNAAEQTKAVLVAACLHGAVNVDGSPVALTLVALCWTLLLIFWNRPTLRVPHISFVVLIGLLLPADNDTLAQTDSTYGSIPREEITPGKAGNFALFDNDFYQNQLFLLGETHGVQKPQEIDVELLKHLNRRVGVRYYIAEVDGTKAHYLNQYLQTGDEQTLMKVFRSWIDEKAQWANRDFVRKIQNIRALNQNLPKKRQIRFVGIDRIQDKVLVGEHLSQLLNGLKVPRDHQPLVDSLVSGLRENKPDSVVASLALTWLADWDTNAPYYQKALGSGSDEMLDLLTNVGYLKTIKSREKTIFANFNAVLPRLHGEKMYGFWGFFHVLQSPPLNSGKPFACLVKESGVKVVSITCSYLDSYMMIPTAFMPLFWQEKGKTFSRLDKFNNDSELMHTEGIDAMRAATTPNSLTLFALDRPGSSARQTPIRIKYAPFMPPAQRIEFDPKRPTTDYFQYIILVRNSDMTEPLVP